MFCTNCGNKLGEAMFCTSCGTPNPKKTNSQAAVTQDKPVTEATPDKIKAEPKPSQAPVQTEVKPSQVQAETKPSKVPVQAEIKPSHVQTETKPSQVQAETKPIPDNVNTEGNPPKKSKKLIPLIAGLIIFILLGGGIGGYFLYQKHIDKQADAVIAYLDDEEYDNALKIYEKYSGKKASFDNLVTGEVKNVVNKVTDSYIQNELDYDSAIKKLNDLGAFNSKELDTVISDANSLIESVETSRIAYNDAVNFFQAGQYEDAINKYNEVISEDSKNYTNAQDGIKEALEEIARIEEEQKRQETEEAERERIQMIKEKTLTVAETYASIFDYQSAITEIEKGLVEVPNDIDLESYLNLYTDYYKQTLAVPSFDVTKYEQTYTNEAENEDENVEIMSISIELPVLQGTNPAYESINQILNNVKETLISEAEEITELARSYDYDENLPSCSYDVVFSIMYNDRLLSIMLHGYLYTGGAHGESIRQTYTFDLSSGQQVELKDLVSNDDNVFSDYLVQEFQRMYEETPEEYWDDAVITLVNSSTILGEMNFYLTEDSLYIYYPPYHLGSHARDFVDIMIPYEGNENIFSFLQ